ncbi:LPS O-antigen chain length determinant protein WzzB [Pseudomonas sp. Leaf48]|uniref:LPS O-antigen chain length determinant protein WzzB n=1 Tax=Pseudomonas sp. Leaf48 TaxID=1736221 RepID=UPI0009EB5D54|nr:Wzz/FepE/Etk N-terminal domain-containing protein [Pseudomonas sp. Leaf48]
MQSNNNAVIFPEDFDFLEFFNDLWRQKIIILAVTLIATFVAGVYAFFSPSIYEAKYYISPPTLENIANLNYGRDRSSALSPFTVDDVYKVFLRNLQSESLRRTFFENNFEPASSRNVEQYERFSRDVVISPVDKDIGARWVVSIRGKDPATVANWVSQYVEQAGQRAQREVISSATKEASVLARNQQLQIDSIRESAKKVREDTIRQVREALAVARASGLEKSLVFTGEGSAGLAGNMVGNDAYLRGSKVLEAELKNLESRESNDPFIPTLRSMQNSYDFYKGLETGEYNVTVYRQDGIVDQPTTPIKPKKALVVILGVILGGLLGTAIALGRVFILKSRRSKPSPRAS